MSTGNSVPASSVPVLSLPIPACLLQRSDTANKTDRKHGRTRQREDTPSKGRDASKRERVTVRVPGSPGRADT